MTSPAMRLMNRILGVLESMMAQRAISHRRLANIEDRLARLDGGAGADLAERQAIQDVIDRGGPNAIRLKKRRS